MKIKHKMKSSWNNTSLFGIILIAPLLLWIVATIVYPLIRSVWMSFTDVDFLGSNSSFVGFNNYIDLIKDIEFWSAFGKSIIWTIGNALLQVILGFATALIINQQFKGKKFVRTWIILSWIIPTIVLAIIWRWVLNSSFGILNYILQALNLIDQPINFLGSLQMAMPTVIFINTWRWFPFLAIIVLAALQTIPADPYEAADIDGANSLQKFIYITFPMLRPTLSVLGLIGTLWSINIFDVIYMLTRGGPAGGTETIPVFVYQKAFQEYAMNKASAAAVLLFLFLLAFVLFYIKVEPTFKEENFLR
ncbi:MAG: multiple sugar transport system permease protein [Halanaerobiales bacterium]|nr:multiple sugar transport system permease protein [Halanaerobiales bacterium]